MTAEVSSNRANVEWFDEDGDFILRQAVIFDSPPRLPTLAPQKGAGAFEQVTFGDSEYTEYTQLVRTDGRVSEWAVGSQEARIVENTPAFCGRPTIGLSTPEKTGTTTINGIATTKYTLTLDHDADSSNSEI